MFWGNGRGVNAMEYTSLLKDNMIPDLQKLYQENGKQAFIF